MILFFILSFVTVIYIQCEEIERVIDVISDLRTLPVDENNRLINHWILYNDNKICHDILQREWSIYGEPPFTSIGIVEGLAEKQLFESFILDENNDTSENDCKFVCLEQGMLQDHLPYPLPTRIHKGISQREFNTWMNKVCLFIEFAIISYNENVVDVYWVEPSSGRNIPAGNVGYGERHTLWQDTTLGHQFLVVDSITNEILANHTVKHSGPLIIKNYELGERPPDYIKEIERLFQMEWIRSRRVTRTFTELGFDKGTLPIDLFASMSTYFYNNRFNRFIEEWDDKGVFVNWWESEVSVIIMPWALKRYWQSRLKTLVESWVGIELELTDIYGMRQYADGARLMTHVDRENTHAASLIINVAQGGMREDWPVEIYDFADRLHEINMKEGEIVYYESARCLHGRMKPLRGSYYVNLFAHYRPVGDNLWFTRPNPENTPKQLLDLGDCSVNNQTNLVECTKVSPPYLSKTLEILHGPQDLFRYWEFVGSSNTSKGSLHSDDLIDKTTELLIDIDGTTNEL